MYRISEVQLAVLRVLWRRGRATVAEVHTVLAAERGLAPTTVATLLRRLEKRGLVGHDTEGRRHVYFPRQTEEQVRTALLTSVTDTVFGGDVAALVSHLLQASDVGPDDLARVQQLLERSLADAEPPDES